MDAPGIDTSHTVDHQEQLLPSLEHEIVPAESPFGYHSNAFCRQPAGPCCLRLDGLTRPGRLKSASCAPILIWQDFK